MAKRSYNNSAGRRPHGEKPYDPNNSFVKKMATKMTDLIPQRSWISKWFNSPNSNGDLANEDTDNGDEHDVDDALLLQPPTKRPRIRMDVTHPPGTFAIQPRGRNLNDNCVLSNVRDDGFVFLENSEAAGPSGLRTLVTSTPAMRMEMRNSMENNMIKQNNCNANGDENSESGESTSGCSSLIPQASRQDGLSQFRKRMDDKSDYMSSQSPRSLFIDSITATRESMSSKRPSFNASYVSNDVNPFDKCSVLSSPFYNGNITFGGSNALGSSAMRRNRRNLAGNCDYQLRIPRRSSVQVKPSNAVNDSSGMSQTAKRILDALEHFSSPIADAKKIPMKTLGISSGKKRGRDEAFDGNQTSRVGLRHLTRELAVPTVPDMLKLKRRQRLQDTTLAARRIITAHSEPPPKQQSSVNSVNQETEYHLRSENESQKYFGKLRAKSKKKPDIEQPVEAVNLPSIQLPITSLPSFDIPLPKPSNSITTTTTESDSKSRTFKFSSPIKLEKNSTSPVKSMNHFTFSKPLTPESSRKIENSKGNSMENSVSESNQTPPTNNFVWTGSSTAPRPKEIKKDKIKETPELKTGSVMDVLGNNFNKSVTKIWECSECFIKNNQNEEHCVACKNARVKETSVKSSTNNLPASSDNQFGAKFKMTSDKWECKCCSVRNPVSEQKCLSCMTPRVEKKITKIEATVLAPGKPDLDKFKPAKDSWECSGCMLRNPSTVISCPCCNASKPGLLKTPVPEKPEASKLPPLSSISTNSTSKKWECPSCLVRNEESATTCVCCTTPNPKAPVKPPVSKTTSGFGDKFKAPAGSWSCESCMVQNKSDADECVACSSSKPGATKKLKAEESAAKFSFGIPSAATQKFTFGIPASEKEEKPKKSEASTFTFGAPTTAASAKFTFGVPTTVQEAAKPSGFTFAAPKSVEPFKSDEKKAELQTLFNNVSDTKVGFSFSKPTESKPEAPKDSIKVPEKEPVKISFGVPATASEDPKTTIAAAAQPVFSFSEPKSSTSHQPPTPVLTFGQSSVSTAPTETPKPETSESGVKPLISFGKPAGFTENTEAKSVLTFGAPAVNNAEKQVFAAENKLPSSGTIEAKSVFGSGNDKPLFNAPAPASASASAPTPAPAFGVPIAPSTTAASASPATPGLFSGSSSSSSIFGSTTPNFGAPSAPAAAPTIFSAVKPAETPPAPASSEIFTFGRGNTTTAPAPAAAAGFGSGNNNAAGWNFGFFNNPASTQQSFGSYGEHNRAPSAFDINAAKSEPPAFGQTAAAPITNIFGNSQPSSASSFGTLNSASTSGGFNFGTPLTTPATATPSSASTSGGFNFASGGAAAPPGQPTSGFSFNAPAQPSFNFTGGNAPTAFSATPQAAATQRKIKKAVRRMQPRT